MLLEAIVHIVLKGMNGEQVNSRDKKIKIMTIFGTRPEAIKLAPVICRLERSNHFNSVLLSTGQHSEMLDQVLDLFNIRPDYSLDIMKPDQDISDVALASFRGVGKLLAEEKPDMVLVQGDTTTAFAGCLAAAYQKITVGHVEAGLRTYDKHRPFPEEINRSLITQLADIHFVPTETARERLRREGIPEEKMFVTGNTVIDSLFNVINPNYRFRNKKLREAISSGRRLIVVTTHRRENFGEPLRATCNNISELVDRFPDIEVVFTVHRNPRVYVPVKSMLKGKERIHLVKPLNYADMINLLSRCYMVMTDSGGLQEEAPALAIPVLVLRDVTERSEAVRTGMARVVGTSRKNVLAAASELLTNPSSHAKMAQGISPYGDGEASRRIVEVIEYTNGLRPEKPDEFIIMPAASLAEDNAVASR